MATTTAKPPARALLEEPRPEHEAAPHRGRPRDPSCGRAILQATIELLAELGYERMSLDAVAHRAG